MASAMYGHLQARPLPISSFRCSSSRFSNSSILPLLSRVRPFNLELGFQIRSSSSSHYHSRFSSLRRIRCSSEIEEDEKQFKDAEEDSESSDEVLESREELNDANTVKKLLLAYKDAITLGDGDAISEIESMLSAIDIEKNNLLEKVAQLSSESKAMKEQYLRMNSDFVNFRKRSDEQQLSLKSDIQREVVESLLPMVDNFERAKQQSRPETEKEKKIDTSYQGIYKQFVETMRSLRVSAVRTVGKPFDPSLHEAIAREESYAHKEGVVIEELRRGFLLGDHLLRPATVKVSSGPGPRKSPLNSVKSQESSSVSTPQVTANVVTSTHCP